MQKDRKDPNRRMYSITHTLIERSFINHHFHQAGTTNSIQLLLGFKWVIAIRNEITFWEVVRENILACRIYGFPSCSKSHQADTRFDVLKITSNLWNSFNSLLVIPPVFITVMEKCQQVVCMMFVLVFGCGIFALKILPDVDISHIAAFIRIFSFFPAFFWLFRSRTNLSWS